LVRKTKQTTDFTLAGSKHLYSKKQNRAPTNDQRSGLGRTVTSVCATST